MLFSNFPTVAINEFLYPTTLLRKVDKGIEKATCLEVIDTNSIRVYLNSIEEEATITFIGLEEINTMPMSNVVINLHKKHLENEEIYLSYDWKSRNEKGEILAYVWVYLLTGVEKYNVLWNEILLLNGYGKLDRMAFNLVKSILFFESYEFAQKKKLGILKNIETEKPVTFSDLPEDAQLFLLDLYKNEITGQDNSGSNETTPSFEKKDNALLNTLKFGIDWEMTPGEIEGKINASESLDRYSGDYAVNLFDQYWTMYLGFQNIEGKGEEEGILKKKLSKIGYKLSGNYTNNQMYEIFLKIKKRFEESFGEPDEIDKVNNNYVWKLHEDFTVIQLNSANTIKIPIASGYVGSFWRNCFILMEYTGDIKF